MKSPSNTPPEKKSSTENLTKQTISTHSIKPIAITMRKFELSTHKILISTPAQHLQDDGAHTWCEATRGEKLRMITHYRSVMATVAQEAEGYSTQGERVLSPIVRQAVRQRWGLAPEEAGKRALELAKEQLRLIIALEKLVVDEAKQGWDWKSGLEAQIAVGRNLDKVANKLRELGEAVGFELDQFMSWTQAWVFILVGCSYGCGGTLESFLGVAVTTGQSKDLLVSFRLPSTCPWVAD